MMPANPSSNPRSPILFTSEGWGCAKCHKKISECICPERQGTRCNHPYPCSKDADSDYDDEPAASSSLLPVPKFEVAVGPCPGRTDTGKYTTITYAIRDEQDEFEIRQRTTDDAAGYEKAFKRIQHICQAGLPVGRQLDVELISAKVHDSWMATKRQMGFHGPNEPCIAEQYNFAPCNPQIEVHCRTFHADLIPYEQLTDAKKELDRATVRTVLKAISELGLGESREPETHFDVSVFPPEIRTKLDNISVTILLCAFAAEQMHGEMFDAKYQERNYEWNHAMKLICELLASMK